MQDFRIQRLHLKIALLVLCFALGLSRSTAQDKQDKEEKKEDQSQTIRVDTDLVSIDVNVTDRDGKRSAVGLRAEDFVIYEDGVRQKVTNFSMTDVPFNLALLIDTSGSTRDEVTLMRRAAQRFLKELRPQDRIAIIQFNKQVDLISPLTSDRVKAEEALDQLKAGSGTSFYDALRLVVDDVFRKVEGRKAIIAMTDGVDSYGIATVEEAMLALEKLRATSYFLELDTESFTEAGMMRDCKERNHFEFSHKQIVKYLKEHLKGGDDANYEDHCSLSSLERMQINRRLYQSAHRELREMAKQSGGRVYPVKELQQLEPNYAQIATELRTQYSLGYYPTNDKHDGKWRALKVEIKRPGFVVNARPGYRAPLD